jgi:hypothetical protein
MKTRVGDPEMGTFIHDAIVVCDYDQGADDLGLLGSMSRIHAKAVELCGDTVTSLTDPVTNGYRSFLIGPDGSKEGWGTSEEYNLKRDHFLTWLNNNRDGLRAEYIHLRFGEIEPEICGHS